MEEKIELYQLNKRILDDAIDRIVVKLYGHNKADNAKTFLFTGAGANVGTTTIAINVAISLAEAGNKTIFLDCDFRKEQKYKRIDKENLASLTDYLSGKVNSPDNLIYNTNVEGLDYVVAGDKNDNPVRLLSNPKMESLLRELKNKYQYIIIDTPSIGVANDAEILLLYVDKYIPVICMNETTKKQLVSARLQLADYEDKFCGIIANRTEIMQYKDEFRDYDYFAKNNIIKKQKDGLNRKVVKSK